MSQKTKIAERRQRHRAIGQRDNEQRCRFCRRVVGGDSLYDFSRAVKFCSHTCWLDFEDAEAQRAAMRSA